MFGCFDEFCSFEFPKKRLGKRLSFELLKLVLHLTGKDFGNSLLNSVECDWGLINLFRADEIFFFCTFYFLRNATICTGKWVCKGCKSFFNFYIFKKVYFLILKFPFVFYYFGVWAKNELLQLRIFTSFFCKG